MTVFGVEYTMTGASRWVRYQVALLTGMIGSTDFDATRCPKWMKHRARDLGQRYGV